MTGNLWGAKTRFRLQITVIRMAGQSFDHPTRLKRRWPAYFKDSNDDSSTPGDGVPKERSGRSQLESSINELHTHRTLLTLQVDLNAKVPTCGVFAEPSDGLEPSTPTLPWTSGGGLSMPFLA